MMKIAYVVPYVPNLIRTRSYNLIVNLSALGHDVEVFTLGSGTQDVEDARLLREKCREVHYYDQPVWRSLLNSALAVPSMRPLQSVYSWQGGMAHDLLQQVFHNKFDVVHVEHIRGSRYGAFLRSQVRGVPVVWDSVDCISNLFQQASDQSGNFFGKIITRFELPRTRLAEGSLVCNFDHVLVTSLVDRDKLLELVPERRSAAPISVLSNGVDFDYFHPDPETRHEPDTLVFSGKMSYHANIKMAQYLFTDIMPRVWMTRPNVKLLIVGKDPPSDVQKLANHPMITVTGEVDDIRPYLWRAAIAVVPLIYGAGIQNKVLEAMAVGLPVIATPKAVSALEIVPGREIVVAEDPSVFAADILRLLAKQDLRSAISVVGLDYVRKHHNWRMIAQQLVDVYSTSMASVQKNDTGADVSRNF